MLCFEKGSPAVALRGEELKAIVFNTLSRLGRKEAENEDPGNSLGVAALGLWACKERFNR